MSGDSQKAIPMLPDGILLEGIVTTLDADGSPHIAPMGPIVNANFSQLLLRPFRTSHTFTNLKRCGTGILHVTDDVELIARAAVGRLENLPRLIPATKHNGVILADACRWYAFKVDSIDDSDERTQILASVVEHATIRDFFGFNRAKHAVLEAAIIATRIAFFEPNHIASELKRLAVLVEKTGGHQERRAFAFLQSHIADELAKREASFTDKAVR